MPIEITDMSLGFASIGSISLICFVIAQVLKLFPAVNRVHGIMPVIILVSGGLLGFIGWSNSMLGLQDMEIMSAIATGIVSGAAASGLFSWYKTVANAFSEHDTLVKELKESTVEDEENPPLSTTTYTYNGDSK